MKRRDLLTLIAGSFLAAPFVKAATPDQGLSCGEEGEGEIIGLSERFFEVRHRHAFVVPLELLQNPPPKGYSARSSTPLRGQTDFEGLRNRTNEDGSPLDLREHAHTVKLTQEDLKQLARGRHITVELPQFGHRFYFVASDETLDRLKGNRE